MLKGAYRKEWFVGACMAKGFLGMEPGDRIPTITQYAEIFECSRGIVQNALADLEQTGVIGLDRQGKLGTFLREKRDPELFRSAGISHLTASMPPPINRHFAGLATGICQTMAPCPVPFTFAFVQGSRNRVESLLTGAYDFVVTTRYSGLQYCQQHPEIQIGFSFPGCRYALPHRLYLNRPGLRGLEDGMTLAVDPSSLDQVAVTRLLCEGKRIRVLEMPFVSSLYGFYTGKLDALVFRDGAGDQRDNLLNLVMGQEDHIALDSISQVEIRGTDPAMEEPVALIHRDNYGIREILGKYLRDDQISEIQKKVMDGTMLPRFY